MYIRTSNIDIGDMRAELQKYMLRESQSIKDTAGTQAATAFIGLPLREGGSAFTYIDPSRVDLKRFPITKLFTDALTFITHPYSRTAMKGTDVKMLKSFMSEIPRIEVDRERYPMQPLEGLCRIIADAAFARWKLDVDLQEKSFSVRELALLAETSEGAVRRALTQKSASGLTALPYAKSVQIEHREARRWLSGQPGFRSWWVGPTGHANLREMLALT